MKWVAVFLALLAPFATFIFIAAAAQPTKEPEAAAEEWLHLVDNGDYDKDSTQAGSVFKASASDPQWRKVVVPARAALGAVVSRDVKEVKLSNTLPGMPSGQYAVVQFNTAFSHKAAAVETLSLDSENDHWAVIGYFIR